MKYSDFSNEDINRMIYARKGACIRVEDGQVALITPDDNALYARKLEDESAQECVDALWRMFSPEYTEGEDMLQLLLELGPVSIALFAYALLRRKSGIQRLVAELWLLEHE